jgi:hypothetical protein
VRASRGNSKRGMRGKRGDGKATFIKPGTSTRCPSHPEFASADNTVKESRRGTVSGSVEFMTAMAMGHHRIPAKPAKSAKKERRRKA